MLQLLLAALVALLPRLLKLAVYRHVFGYRIGRNVRIGFSPFLRVRHCTIEDGARIGHFNLFCDVNEVVLGTCSRVGYLNLFRGGQRIRLGAYASVLRLNVLNSIPEAEVLNARCPECDIGEGAVLTSGHWLDSRIA